MRGGKNPDPRCSFCGAPITWALTKHAKRMPIDRDPSPNGNVLLEPSAKTLPNARVLTGVDMFEGSYTTRRRYTSHFATCPFSFQHRKGRT